MARPALRLGAGGDRSAAWFRTVLDEPVVPYVWLNDDRCVYAARFVHADEDRTISRL